MLRNPPEKNPNQQKKSIILYCNTAVQRPPVGITLTFQISFVSIRIQESIMPVYISEEIMTLYMLVVTGAAARFQLSFVLFSLRN